MDRVGRRSLLMGSYGGMAASMLLLTAALAVPQLHDSGAGSVLSVVGTLAYVFTFALGAGPVTAILLPEIFNTRIRAKGMAVSLCVHWVSVNSLGSGSAR
jgi:MFS family permease